MQSEQCSCSLRFLIIWKFLFIKMSLSTFSLSSWSGYLTIFIFFTTESITLFEFLVLGYFYLTLIRILILEQNSSHSLLSSSILKKRVRPETWVLPPETAWICFVIFTHIFSISLLIRGELILSLTTFCSFPSKVDIAEKRLFSPRNFDKLLLLVFFERMQIWDVHSTRIITKNINEKVTVVMFFWIDETLENYVEVFCSIK